LTGVASPELLEDAAVVRQRVHARLERVDRIVAVMSGKGGVGKSAVAVSLAVALARAGHRTGLLDADLHGPSVAQMLGLRGRPVRVGPEQAATGTGAEPGEFVLRPVEGPDGLRVQSMDFFLQGNQPLDWDGESGEGAPLRSAMEQAALADLLGQTAWGDLDSLVVDLAPGSDRLLALSRWLPPRVGALAVTVPTEVAMLAVERSLRRAHAAGIPVIGLVENMASTVCQRCGAEGPLFHEASVDDLVARTGVEVVARIPFDPALSRAADAGRSFFEGEVAASPAVRALEALAETVAKWEAPGPEGESW
jgi:ATP-binding protein involved in chromosome partitioning